MNDDQAAIALMLTRLINDLAEGRFGDVNECMVCMVNPDGGVMLSSPVQDLETVVMKMHMIADAVKESTERVIVELPPTPPTPMKGPFQ